MNILEARRRLLEGGVKKRTAEGNPIVVRSLARMYPGLNIYGWSKQDGTPSPDNPVTIVSAGSGGEIGVTVQGGNLVNIPDIPAGDGKLNIMIPADISAPFVVSVDDSDVVIEGVAVWRLEFDFEDGSSVYAIDKKFPMTINANPENKVVAITYRDIRMASGTYRNFMINYGSTPLPYEPYKQPQTLMVSTPGGLPGIPVDASKLPEGMTPTYVDESGQAWVCDEVDFERGVYVRRVWKHTFDGSGEDIWRLCTIPNLEGFYSGDVLPEAMQTREGFANQFEIYTGATQMSIRFGANNTFVYAVKNQFYDPSLEDSGISAWKAHLAAHPLEVMTYLTTVKEEPLTNEEIITYKALHTYRPTTMVSNDADTWVKFKYKTRKGMGGG